MLLVADLQNGRKRTLLAHHQYESPRPGASSHGVTELRLRVTPMTRAPGDATRICWAIV